MNCFCSARVCTGLIVTSEVLAGFSARVDIAYSLPKAQGRSPEKLVNAIGRGQQRQVRLAGADDAHSRALVSR